MASRPISIVIADHQRMVREGLAALLRAAPGIRLLAEAATGIGLFEKVVEIDPDVLVVEAALPEMDGAELTRRIRASHPRTEIVVLSADDRGHLQKRAFEAGARAFVLTTSGFETLLEAIRHAAHGEYFASGFAADDRVANYARRALREQKPGGIVTPREREIACLLADGYSTKEAAARLNISVKTAETHRASIMRKLGARNVADVVKYCIRNQLIDL
jgi:DNA-binding NarL/FixJ family response regulator